jgi:hypothetical protein
VNRRAFFRNFGFICGILLTGCTGRDDWNPTISGSEPALAPDEETEISIEATDIGGFSFLPSPEGIQIGMSLDKCEVTPSPDSGNDSYPPQWFWSSPSDVTVEAPLKIEDTVESGEYQYGVEIYRDEDHDEKVREQFDITIAESG